MQSGEWQTKKQWKAEKVDDDLNLKAFLLQLQ